MVHPPITPEAIFVIPTKSLEEPKQGNGQDKGMEAADFETAIKETQIGKFNLMLVIIGIPSLLATSIESSTMSYVIPIAQCDLDLSVENKGTLNAITYIGMLPSAFFWGYLADTIGRKKPLAIAYLLTGIAVVLCGLSQEYTMLLVAKFLTGLTITGSFSTLTSYVNEFHAAKQRAMIPLAQGMITSLSGLLLPIVGWLTFTDAINISLLDGYIVLRSWNIFFIICAIPSLVAGITYFVLPESPKYLMSMGENEAAMKIFKKIYSSNTGNAPETFPITTLVDERNNNQNSNVTAHRSTVQALKEGWHQIIPLFHKPYLSKMILAFTIEFGILTSINTLRLWLPQIFAAINDYQMFNKDDKNPDLCKMLESITAKNATVQECSVNYNNSAIYINSIIVSSVYMFFCTVGVFIMKKIGKKAVLVSCEIVAGFATFALYFATNEEFVVALSSIFISASGIGAMVIISIIVDIFPTTLRTMTLALAMMLGRTGAMAGNLVFPFLLQAGCFPPFLTIGLVAFGSAFLCLLLPNTDSKALE